MATLFIVTGLTGLMQAYTYQSQLFFFLPKPSKKLCIFLVEKNGYVCARVKPVTVKNMAHVKLHAAEVEFLTLKLSGHYIDSLIFRLVSYVQDGSMMLSHTENLCLCSSVCQFLIYIAFVLITVLYYRTVLLPSGVFNKLCMLKC